VGPGPPQPQQEFRVPTITVQKLSELDDEDSRLLKEIHDRISRRAYDVYEHRDATYGSSVDDWLRAEQEVCWVPREELQETERAVHLKIGVSGVGEETIEVKLVPEMIILRGVNKNGSDVDSYERRPKVLFRKIVLPSQIHTESAVVRLEADLLMVSAAKLEPA
jgi:HSP20 family molecular chaperone IbpA